MLGSTVMDVCPSPLANAVPQKVDQTAAKQTEKIRVLMKMAFTFRFLEFRIFSSEFNAIECHDQPVSMRWGKSSLSKFALWCDFLFMFICGLLAWVEALLECNETRLNRRQCGAACAVACGGLQLIVGGVGCCIHHGCGPWGIEPGPSRKIRFRRILASSTPLTYTSPHHQAINSLLIGRNIYTVSY